MIAALQSSLSAKDMELEVNMKCILQGLLQAFTSRSTENMCKSIKRNGNLKYCPCAHTCLLRS